MRQHKCSSMIAALLLQPWLLLSGAGCTKEQEASAERATVVKKEPVLVRVTRANKKRMSSRIEVSGNILQSQKAAIAPTVPGVIRRVFKQEGDRVRKGEPLVRLDARDFRLAVEQATAAVRAARAGTAAAKTGLANLEVQYRRFTDLRKKGAVAQVEYEKVETGYKSTKSRHEAAAAQARLAEVGLKTARKKLADTVAYAPFDGVITQRMMDPGEMARMMPPSVVLMLMAIDPVKAVGQVAERDLAAIRKDARVEVIVDSLPDTHFEGKVEVVVPFVDPATRTAKVRVRIPNPEYVLKPGMAASLRISMAEREVLSVPREAVVARGERGKAFMFVVDKDQRARRRQVTLDTSEQGGEVIVLNGLNTGEQVVIAGVADLTDGQPVRLEQGHRKPPDKPTAENPAEVGR